MANPLAASNVQNTHPNRAPQSRNAPLEYSAYKDGKCDTKTTLYSTAKVTINNKVSKFVLASDSVNGEARYTGFSIIQTTAGPQFRQLFTTTDPDKVARLLIKAANDRTARPNH